MKNTLEQQQAAGFVLRSSLAVTFAMHLLIATGWWWMSPKGFPVDHSRFWLNSILPWLVMAAALVGLIGLFRERPRLSGMVALLFASGWLGGAIAGRVLFPLSLRGFWELGLVIAIGGFGYAWNLLRVMPHLTWRLFSCGLVGVSLGVLAAWAQLPPHPSTHPINTTVTKTTGELVVNQPVRFELGNNVRYEPKVAELTLNSRGIAFYFYPLLRFVRPSPDGFWSLLAPREVEGGRSLLRVTQDATHYSFQYSDSTLVRLPTEMQDGTLQWTSWSPLAEETYSHLNSFCRFKIQGSQNLLLSFSPCPDKKIEVLPADYPTGRPARFAYLTEQEEFTVVEATSGEKGPFRSLATGALRRGEPLSIKFYDGKLAVATLTLDDWTKQLSTDLSPTAGWGVPMNAIEFHRTGDDPRAAVDVFITLAATSVGRGWETVGHRAGTYRNQLSFRLE